MSFTIFLTYLIEKSRCLLKKYLIFFIPMILIQCEFEWSDIVEKLFHNDDDRGSHDFSHSLVENCLKWQIHGLV